MKKQIWIAALTCLVLPTLVSANTVYTYVGKPFNVFNDNPLMPGAYGPNDHVTLTIETLQPFAPNSTCCGTALPLPNIVRASISDGRISVDNPGPFFDSW